MLRPSHRGWLWTAAAPLAIALVAASTPVALATEVPVETVTLQLKWKHQFQFAGYYAAIEQGYYRDAGLEVRLVEAQEGVEPARAVLSGAAEFGIATSDLALLRSQGHPVVALAPIFQHSPLILLAARAAGIDNVHQLIGKRIMMEPHAAELLAYLQHEGVAADRMVMLPHSFDPRALLEGKVDVISAYSTDEPFLLGQNRFDTLTFTPRSGGIDFYGDTLFTTEREVRAHPARVRSFVNASLRGWQYALANPEALVQLILTRYSTRHSAEHLRFEAEATRRLILPEVVEVGYMNPGRWRHIADTYAEVGMMPPSFPLDGLLWQREPRQRLGWLYASLAGALLLLAFVAMVAARFYQLNRTVRRQMTELREAEQRYRSLTENAPFPIAITRLRDGTLRYLNPAAALQIEVSRDFVLGKDAAAVYADLDDRRVILDLLQRQGFVHDVEVRLRTATGREFWAILSAAIIDYEGERAIIVSFEDITARKRAEEERLLVQRHLMQLQRLESLGVLAGGVAHNFNNLLAVMLTNLEVAALRLPPRSAAHASLDTAIDAVRRAAALTGQMLAYSGKAMFFTRQLDLGDLVRSSAELFRATLPPSVTMLLDLDHALPRIEGDAGQIQQLILNLLVNASEAIGERTGTVTLSTAERAYDAAALAASHLEEKPLPGRFVTLVITDTGDGMDPTVRQHLFEPFISTKAVGRGLGLSAVAGIVRHHRGAVFVSGETGAGTTVTVAFPATAAPTPDRVPS